ncbi:MAG TPA: DUF6506 family protein [Methanomassiliicoccales archaeon]|nr:DUF6506 family protein [Methanomassiliicoccales archaeon]
MSENKFITAFVAMSPDADPGKHRCVIETSVQRLYSVLVRDERQAEEVCAELVRKEGVCSIILCPGFTNQAVGRLSEALGRDVAVNVARGDGPSGAVAHRAMERAGFLRH